MTEEVSSAPAAEKPFVLEVGDVVRAKDGSYLTVLATALVEGVPSVVVRAFQPTSEPAGDGTSQMVSLAIVKDMIDSGKYELGHAPK